MRLQTATLLLAAAAPGETHAGKPTNAGPPPRGSDPGPGEPSFTDDLTSFDTTRWAKADGWGNGDVFDNGWRAEKVAFGVDGMTITLDDTPFTADGDGNNPNPDTYPYTSGELRTTGYHGYGCYEVTMKPVAESGVVSAFFTYAGPWDNPDGGNGQHDEIDIEFLGKNTNHFQANYWTNGVGSHEVEVDLGFDASEDFHRYGFKWKASGIEWWVDGIKVYQVDDATSGSDPVPKITDMTQKIMMNLWPVDIAASAWAGTFNYPGSPLKGQWKDVSFKAGEGCIMDGPPSTTTTATAGSTTTGGSTEFTPTGGTIDATTTTTTTTTDGGSLHVDIVMDTQSKGPNWQGVATVTVTAGSTPVDNANVMGVWNELAGCGGETDGTTDAVGVVLLYSQTTKQCNPGTHFTFCVTDVDGSTFDPNICDDIEVPFRPLHLDFSFGTGVANCKEQSSAAASSSTSEMEEPSPDVPLGDDSPRDVFRDAHSPHSLQNPPPPLPTSSPDLSQLSPQEAADALFRDAEILAPMVRASTTPLRTLALSYGASLTFTEELVDRSITPTERIVNEELSTIDYRVPKHTYSKKVQRRLDNDKDNPDYRNGAIILRIDPTVERNKLIYQIGTGESSLALEAATKVIQDVNGMDVNMGCPKKFSVSGGMGSALLSDTKRACDIISTLRRNLSKPVSAKIRLLDPDDPRPTLDFVRALIKAGANAITIHGRIVGDESHTQARWPTLVEVVRQLKQTESVPVTVNGDLYTRADIRKMKRRTGCDGVMLARPALYNVSLFRRGEDETADASSRQESADEMDLAEFQTTNHAGPYGYHSPLLAPRTKVVQDYISHCVRYRAHSKNAKYVVCEVLSSRRTPTNRVPHMNMAFDGGQTIDKVCKCRNLQDLAKLWDVRWTVPLLPGKESAATAGKAVVDLGEVEAHVDQHRYDDRYFLDHDKFRKERTAAVDAQLGEAAAEEKKTDDGEDGPAAKRTKV